MKCLFSSPGFVLFFPVIVIIAIIQELRYINVRD